MEFLNTCFETTHEVRLLALYSHLLPATVATLLGFFVYKMGSRTLTRHLFVLFTLLLSLWLICDLITWHANNYFIVASFWSVLDYINILFFLVFVGFFITFSRNLSTMPWWLCIGIVLLASPAFLITFSGISVGVFDETNCEMASNESLAVYKLGLEMFSIYTCSKMEK
jgi:hypothetical protein